MLNLDHNTILQAIHRSAIASPQKTAIIAGDRSIDYGSLWSHILKASSYLLGLGLDKGDRILLSANKELEFIYLYFGAQLAGIVNVIVDPTANDDRRQLIIDTTQPKAIFGMATIDGNINYADILFPYQEPPIAYAVSPDDIAEMLFTTGTTGAPKCAMLSHSNICGSAANINHFIQNTSADVEVIGLPLCHSFGLGRLRCNMLNGATIVLLNSFANIPAFFKAIETHNVTGFGMVPAVWEYLRKLSGDRIGRYANRLNYIEIGSAAMPTAEKEHLAELFPHTRICMHYGLTEASRALFMEFHDYADSLDSIGTPTSSAIDVKILDDNGREVAIGESGEICIAGNMVMQGYLNQSRDTAFHGSYFRTGDIGRRDASGRFFLEGRSKEIINVGGKKVSPKEVEDAIISLGFDDCAVVGIPDPKGLLGEVVKAFVKSGKVPMDIADIPNALRSRLESYKIPVVVQWIDNIPYTQSGKKQRLQLK